MALEHVYRLDLQAGSLTSQRRTQQGGLIAKANLTRTGVFEYRNADGSTRRELRPPEEIFHPDSLPSYAYATATVDHPGRVGPHNWKSVSVGHVAEGARANGNFVEGEVHVQDGDAINRIESGDLHELSCGYTCDVELTPGEFDGQKYDAIQRNVRINHVALLPKGAGRMGREVCLRLDSNAAVSGGGDGVAYVRADSSNPNEGLSMAMTPEEKAALEKAQDDAKKSSADLERARQDAKDAKTEGEKLAAQTRADAAEIAKLRAENDALKLQNEARRKDGVDADQKAADEAKLQKRLEELVAVRADACVVFASADDPDGKKYPVVGKTAEQLRFEIIAHLSPKIRLDGIKAIANEDLRAEALRPAYEAVMSHKREVDKARADAIAAASGPADGGGDGDGDDNNVSYDAAKARKDMIARKRDGWKKGKATVPAKA